MDCRDCASSALHGGERCFVPRRSCSPKSREGRPTGPDCWPRKSSPSRRDSNTYTLYKWMPIRGSYIMCCRQLEEPVGLWMFHENCAILYVTCCEQRRKCNLSCRLDFVYFLKNRSLKSHCCACIAFWARKTHQLKSLGGLQCPYIYASLAHTAITRILHILDSE